jgi:hypothetical protein
MVKWLYGEMVLWLIVGYRSLGHCVGSLGHF